MEYLTHILFTSKIFLFVEWKSCTKFGFPIARYSQDQPREGISTLIPRWQLRTVGSLQAQLRTVLLNAQNASSKVPKAFFYRLRQVS